MVPGHGKHVGFLLLRVGNLFVLRIEELLFSVALNHAWQEVLGLNDSVRWQVISIGVAQPHP